MNVVDIMGLCVGVASAAAAIVQCVLMITASSRAVRAGAGASISITNVVQATWITPRVATPGASGSAGNVPRSNETDPWTFLFLTGIAMVAVGTLYARYRPWVLLVVAAVIAICFLVNVLTLGLMYQRKVIDRGLAIGWSLDALGYAGALALILRLALRTTPYGDYGEIQARLATGSIGVLLQQPDLMSLLVFEVAALALLTLVVIVSGLARLGLLSLINAVARGRRPGVLCRFAPSKPHAVWSGPVTRLVFVALAWAVSSLTLQHWMATGMRLPF